MLKNTIYTVLLMLFFISITNAQDVKISPYGVTERKAAESTEDIFDLPFNGITNVGVGTKVYLKGSSNNGSSSGLWNIVKLPTGSTAAYGTQVVIDTNTAINSITLDLIGTYTFQYSNGADFDEITFNAGTYLGSNSGSLNCSSSFCHGSTIVPKWLNTKHATTLERGLKGTLSSHFNNSCVRCHSTGYDANAINDGFDDRTPTFVFPDTLTEEAYNKVLADFPSAMELANVQCESCHGHGSAHNGNTSDSKMVSSLTQENCAKCHDAGTHHVFPSQWDVSAHATLTGEGAGQTRSSCAPCHNGAGFVKYVKGGKVGLTENEAENVNITCATCHDPHDAANTHQLRTVEVTLENGDVVTDGGMGKLCMNCHRTRRDAVDYTTNYLNNLSSHYGPHHGPQAEVLLAKNYPDLGKTFNSSMHYNPSADACVSCHMNSNQGAVDANNNVLLSGGHSFRMSTPDGVDNVIACTPCHSFESFDKIPVTVDGVSDLDGDGTEEGLQGEVHGMLEEIAMMLPPLGSAETSTIDSSWTPLQAKAFYIWEMVEEDKSFGVHNKKFVTEILLETITQLKGATSVDLVDGVPMTYALEQNYPNPFNPSTTIKFSIPEAGNVNITVFDALGKQIKVLVNEELTPGNYNTNWNAGSLASGIYFYRIQTNNFVSVKKMILVK